MKDKRKNSLDNNSKERGMRGTSCDSRGFSRMTARCLTGLKRENLKNKRVLTVRFGIHSNNFESLLDERLD